MPDVAPARGDVRTILEAAGVDASRVDLAELAAGESIANAVEHGDGSTVSIAIHVVDRTIVLAVSNEGPDSVHRPADLTEMLMLERSRGLTTLENLGWLVAIDRDGDGRSTVTASLDLSTHDA